MDKQHSGKILFWGGLIFTAVVLSWPVLMVLSELTGTVEEQLRQIADAPSLFMANFFVASLIAPAILVLMLTFAFAVETGKRIPLFDRLGTLFLAAYITLVSLAYTSQYAYLPRILNEGNLELAKLWYFESPLSIPYFLNQLGYAFFSAAALLIGYKLLFESSLLKYIGILLWASGLLSLVAFAGLALQIEGQGFLSIISGILTLPVGIMAIIWGRKLMGGENDRETV